VVRRFALLSMWAVAFCARSALAAEGDIGFVTLTLEL
jgi:hypothetical protein